MKNYKIPISFLSVKEYNVQAKTLQEAVEMALKKFFSEPDENYISDSFEIDSIVDDNYSDEEYDINEIINNI